MADDAETVRSRGTARLAQPDQNPSFTRGIFMGEIREDLVAPFPEATAEDHEALAMILGAFRDFAAEHIDPARHDREGRFTEEAREGMHELGLMGLNIPEAYGGFGASTMVFSRVFGEIGAHRCRPRRLLRRAPEHRHQGHHPFRHRGSAQRWLPRCASGELIGAFCLTEPGSGSDAQAMLCAAVPTEDGKHYILNGTKMWISNAGYAGVFTVFAKVPVMVDGKQKQRVTAFIVDAHAQASRSARSKRRSASRPPTRAPSPSRT
jgi:alkylation response protein AidB-like acyl-CoA dehydrogenase